METASQISLWGWNSVFTALYPGSKTGSSPALAICDYHGNFTFILASAGPGLGKKGFLGKFQKDRIICPGFIRHYFDRMLITIPFWDSKKEFFTWYNFRAIGFFTPNSIPGAD